MRIYVVWHEGGWGGSGYVSAAGLDKKKLIEKENSDWWDEIKIYDSETMKEIESCTVGHKYTYKDWDCRCSECKEEKH